MKDLLEYTARFLVDEPEQVRVEPIEGQKSMILQLHVAPGDMGKIIGRNGRVARALRTLVAAAATREGVSAIVEIVQ